MLLALQRIQDEQTPDKRRQKPIRVVFPVNLRRLFPSRTLRNFVHVIMPEIDPRMGDYEFSEILTSVKHQLGLLVTKKNLCAMFTPNVNAERSPLLRVMPLFLKNIAMFTTPSANAQTVLISLISGILKCRMQCADM